MERIDKDTWRTDNGDEVRARGLRLTVEFGEKTKAELLCKVKAVREENAKLRDAIAVLWECCAWETDSVGWCDGCDYHDEDNGGCKVEKVLHELGIEAK